MEMEKTKILLKEKLHFFGFAKIYVDQALERSADSLLTRNFTFRGV